MLIEVLNYFGERENEGTCVGLYPKILKSYIISLVKVWLFLWLQ